MGVTAAVTMVMTLAMGVGVLNVGKEMLVFAIKDYLQRLCGGEGVLIRVIMFFYRTVKPNQ